MTIDRYGPTPPGFMDIRAAGARLSLRRSRVHQLADAGHLDAFIGRARRRWVSIASVDRYVASPPPPTPRTFAARPAETPEQLLGRLMQRVALGPDCWTWTGPVNNKGYGRHGARSYVHRTIFELTVRPLATGEQVCHHCDNPPCVRPSHLFAGSQSDNMRDMVAKSRHAAATHPEAVVRGERVGGAKLTDGQVRELREASAVGGVSQMDLSRRYGISHHNVRLILANRIWTHVEAVA